MSTLEDELKQRLADIRRQGLYRELRRVGTPQGRVLDVNGRALLNFSSNDYLGLANHPALRTAARESLEAFGVGSGASRLICGSLEPHPVLEEALAAFKGTEAALVFSSGYATALGCIGAILGKEDVIVLDRQVHACIVDAARLSGAKMRVFAHNDVADLERILVWAEARRGAAPSAEAGRGRVLVVVESVYSMDGDQAPLREIVELKERHGAWLMVDEAHATGLFGKKRRGVAEAQGLADRLEIQMGTLGKALGAAGGYICGSRVLIDFLVNRARSFIFSTAPSPALSAAAAEAVRLVQGREGERRGAHLWELIHRLKEGLLGLGRALPQEASAIFPLIVGEADGAVALADDLRAAGIYAPAIRYPTVARGAARLRLTLTAAHTKEDVDRLLDVLSDLIPKRIPLRKDSAPNQTCIL